MNKLLFILEIDFCDDIKIIANNHKDLEDYLSKNYDWYDFEMTEDNIIIETRKGYSKDYGTLTWVKHI